MTMKTPESEAEVASHDLFADWWSKNGSLPPESNEDHAEHTERIARLAFEAGALTDWRMNAGKWWCQYCLSVVEPECVTFEECHDPRSGGCGGPVQVIPANDPGMARRPSDDGQPESQHNSES
jgi:hypothetical protein